VLTNFGPTHLVLPRETSTIEVTHSLRRMVEIAEKWVVLMINEINLSLRLPLRFPIRAIILDDLPKLLAGGLPVTPIT
jgi:hypothetical protein